MKTEGNLKESIYNAILEGIFNCEYKANQILNEKELTIRYNCSKSPVREALVTLCNENVLRNIPRYGYEVVRLTAEDVEDMLHFRFLLEGGMLKSNFLSFNAFQLEKLRALDESCCNEENDVWRHWESNVDFHLQMIAFSQNDCAYTELKRIMERLKRAYAQFYWNKWDKGMLPMDTKNHKEMIACIEEKDDKALLAALKNDLKDFGEMQCNIPDYF